MNLPRAPWEKYQEGQSSFGYLRRQKWTDALALSTTRLTTAQATSASITTVTTFTAQPDFARQITILPGGTTADVKAGDYVITGTNIRGEVISDTLVFADNATVAQTSVKAFKTVTSIVYPVQDGTAATFAVGINDALGLDRCMNANEVILVTVAAGVFETTRPTVTFHATDVSRNTIDPNTALDAAKDVTCVFVSTEKTTKQGSSA